MFEELAAVLVTKLVEMMIPELKMKVQEFIKKLKDKRDITDVVKNTFAHYPEPFYSPAGVDAVFVFGASKPEKKRFQFEVGGGGGLTADIVFTFELLTQMLIQSFKVGVNLDNVKIQSYLDTNLYENQLLGSKIRSNHNLICIGSGIINMLTAEIQSVYASLLPVHFDTPQGCGRIISKLSGSSYSLMDYSLTEGEGVGLLELVPNPYNEKRDILIIAGTNRLGTQAAAMALAECTDEIRKNNLPALKSGKGLIPAKIIAGFDRNRDGRIEEIEILE